MGLLIFYNLLAFLTLDPQEAAARQSTRPDAPYPW